MTDSPPVESAWKSWQEQPDDEAVEATYRAAVADLRSAPTLKEGEIVADAYRLDAVLGEGGLCTTWRATDLRDGLEVAFKVLHPRFSAKAPLVKRFHAAIHQQGQVAERGVMRVANEGDTWHGFAWAAVHLGAADLTGRLPELDDVDRTQVLIDVATALHNAHAVGLAHGRLSPQNVLVDADGAAWLTDFALVPPQALDSPFAPPEAGDPAYRPSVVADRYAFAMLVAWLLRGGSLPYWAARDPLRAIDELYVSRELREALERSTGWDPDGRPDDLGDLLRALRGDAGSVRSLAERSMAHERPEAALDHYRHLLAVTAGDPDVRVELAGALASAGRERQAIDQLYAALRAPKLRSLEQALDTLRGLVDRSGELSMLLHALEQRASEPYVQNDVILVEIARLKGRLHEDDEDEAWKRALEHHTRRDQARLCLWALTETAAAKKDDQAFVAWGSRLAPLVDDRPAFAYRMGLAQERLDDPEAALHWLEQALEGDTPPSDVHERIESIRSDRGDWGQVVEGLRARALTEDDPVPLWRKAARIAHRAAGDEALAAELYTDVARTVRSDVEARCFLADLSRRQDEPVAEREHLLQLDPASRTDEELPPSARAARLIRLATLHREDGHADDATRTVASLLELEPASVAGLWLQALLSRDAGEDPSAPLERLMCLLPPDDDDGAAATLALAEHRWLLGARGQSYDLAQQVLACRPGDPDATWALVRAAFGPDDDALPWLRALPRQFPLREGLARLVEVAVDLDQLDLPTPPDATPLEQSAALVDQVVRSGSAHDLLMRIAATHSEARDLAEALARAWSGQPDSGWSVRPLVQCNPSTRDRAQRTVRDALPPPTTSSPWAQHLSPLAADDVPLRDQVDLPDDAAPVDSEPDEPGDVRGLELVVHPGDLRQESIPLALEGPRTLGSGAGCDVRVEGLQPQHATLEVVHDAVYLVSHGEPVRIAGIETEEVRLRQGVTGDLGGVRIEVRATGADAPMLDLADLQDDDPTSIHPAESDPAAVALFVTDAGEDFLLPLDDVTPLADGHRLLREADGWRLQSDDAGASSLYVVGDHFVLGEVRYALRPVLSVTPAPAPRMANRSEAVPTLVVNDGTLLGRVVALKNPRTTVGRGRGADVRLSDDTRVSRHHCAFEIRQDGTVVVVDTGSANGTFVDGEQVADEQLVKPGEIIEVGDTSLEFQLGSYVEPEALDDDSFPEIVDLEASPTLMLPASHVQRLSLSDGRHRMAIANRALSSIMHSFDDTIGPGAAAGELQFLLEASPKRFQTVFETVDAKSTGLPALPILHNIARLPDWEQRSLLNAALLDLLERATQRCADRLDEEACADMLGAVAASNYRKHLKL